MTGRRGPLAMEIDNGLGNDGDRFAHFGTGLLPVCTAHPGKTRGLAPGIANDRSQLVGRNIDPILTMEPNQQVVPFDTCHLTMDEAFKTPDPMMVVNDVVACAQIAISLSGVLRNEPAAPSVSTSSTCDLTLPNNPDP